MALKPEVVTVLIPMTQLLQLPVLEIAQRHKHAIMGHVEVCKLGMREKSKEQKSSWAETVISQMNNINYEQDASNILSPGFYLHFLGSWCCTRVVKGIFSS